MFLRWGSQAAILCLIICITLTITGCTSEGYTTADEPETEQQKSESSSNDKLSSEESISASGENENTNTEEPQEKQGDANAKVTNVVDGDTIDIQLNGKEKRVRLLLVDTPETVHPSKPVQPLGPEASTYAKKTLTGENVRIEYDGPKYDKYDRLLAYIWIEGENFNKELLEKGLARYAYVYDPPYAHAKAMQKAESRAKQQKKGIWGLEGYVTEDGFQAQSPENEGPPPPSNNGELPYAPDGPDRDCRDFSSQEEAQAFYEAAGGPDADPHRLDGNDNDGSVCESL
ncbi:thermonuclease family protein [Halobacillus sp. H74]|uniref:thermonuclease family protein n=1 Tax=Halobacillus sp. H74 TaxID=3457436 RepID=UPI003FCE8363